MTNIQLHELLENHLAGCYVSVSEQNDEIILELAPNEYHAVCQILHDHADFMFEQLIDLCGVDYADYPDELLASKGRFAVVVHLLSHQKNMRIRLRCVLIDEQMPLLTSVCDIWRGANWFEREAFDLFGILFEGHQDLRRILTDYGFVGHPFRKDFPMVGHVEMRYDPEQNRVVYEPVSIEERVLVPKVYRA